MPKPESDDCSRSSVREATAIYRQDHAVGADPDSPESPAGSPHLDDLAELAGLDDLDFVVELGDRIVKIAAHAAALEYRLLVLIAEFDRREGWATGGYRDCAAWLEMYTGMSRITARERVRMARKLGELPKISQAMARGELSYSKVRALVRVATPENESELLPMANESTARRLEKEVSAFRELGQWGDLDADRRRHAKRSLRVGTLPDGMVEVRGRVAPEVGALLMKVLDAASDALFHGDREWSPEAGTWGLRVEEVSPAQRWADALHLVLERAMVAGLGDVGAEVAEADEGGTEDAAEGAPGSEADRVGIARDGARPDGAESEWNGDPGWDEAEEPGCDERECGPAACDEASETGAPFGCHVGAGCPAAATCDHAPTDSAESRSTAGGLGVPSSSAERYLVLVHVDESALTKDAPGRCDLDGEVPIPPETARRLTCDASIVRIVRGPAGQVLDVGRKTRVVPPAIRRALRARDGGCRFPGCRSRYARAHHIEHWARGGTTSLDNLVLLCRRHHRGVHEGGFSVRMDRNGQPDFFNRGGVRLPVRAPPPALADRVTADPVGELVRVHRFRGSDPDEWAGVARRRPSDSTRMRFAEALDPAG